MPNGRNKTNLFQIKQIDLGDLCKFVKFLAKRLKKAERQTDEKSMFEKDCKLNYRL